MKLRTLKKDSRTVECEQLGVRLGGDGSGSQGTIDDRKLARAFAALDERRSPPFFRGDRNPETAGENDVQVLVRRTGSEHRFAGREAANLHAREQVRDERGIGAFQEGQPAQAVTCGIEDSG